MHPLLLKVVVHVSVVANQLRIGLDEGQLRGRGSDDMHYTRSSTRTVGMTLNSALEPNAGSPTTILDSCTGGLDIEKRVFTMYG